MSEKDLCVTIETALNPKKLNTWYTFRVISGEKVAIFEVLFPSKGRTKIRKPFKKSFDNKYFYILYRITAKMELYDMGIIEAERPKETEVVTCECV